MADNGVKKEHEKSDKQLLKIVLIAIEFTAPLQYRDTLVNGCIERGFTLYGTNNPLAMAVNGVKMRTKENVYHVLE